MIFLEKNLEFNRLWAKKFKENPKKYRPLLNRFINAQILHAQKQLNKLSTEKLIKIFKIKNQVIIEQLNNRNK